MIKSYKYIFVQILFVISIVFGQFSKDLTVHTYSDDNLFRTPDSLKIQDMLSSINFGVKYKQPETNTNFYNNTSLILYKKMSDRNFLLNSAGINKNIQIGEKSNSNVYLGGNWSLRINQIDYNYYNYSQLSGYVNYQLLTDIVIIKSGYSYRWRNYTNWTDLSNHLHNAHLQLNKSFTPGTNNTTSNKNTPNKTE